MIRVSKGTRFDQDAYSAFDDTGLASFLRRFHIKRLWIGGLAEDVCVMHTALDAMKEGFEAHLIRAATRPVHPEKEPETLETLRNSGVIVEEDRKSTRLNSSHVKISYAVFCLKK